MIWDWAKVLKKAINNPNNPILIIYFCQKWALICRCRFFCSFVSIGCHTDVAKYTTNCNTATLRVSSSFCATVVYCHLSWHIDIENSISIRSIRNAENINAWPFRTIKISTHQQTISYVSRFFFDFRACCRDGFQSGVLCALDNNHPLPNGSLVISYNTADGGVFRINFCLFIWDCNINFSNLVVSVHPSINILQIQIFSYIHPQSLK